MPGANRRRGLIKLMLRLPALRGQLQIAFTRDDGVASLCGAFDDATTTLDLLLRDEERNGNIVAEYRQICQELETDLIAVCMSIRPAQRPSS